MNHKGFTLMEILAVLLILAVVASFAVPMFRKVRDEVHYQQARSAALKMADAVRSFYQNTKGYYPEGCIGPSSYCVSANEAAKEDCDNVGATGIPSKDSNKKESIEQLFACGYLSAKDFIGLPYEFWSSKDLILNESHLVKVEAKEKAGIHYPGRFYVERDMTLTESI